jgi:hypothetical protein
MAEVFGYPIDNLSANAEHCRVNKLCPYHNKVQQCTKDKADDPLGVCSVFGNGDVAITCPIRFRQNWTILKDAASFFFQPGTNWAFIEEVKLADANGESAGNIDFMLVSHDRNGVITDFGSLEVQAVYISGNVRKPFEHYMADRVANQTMTWHETVVRPDYLSSSRKRLVPQMIYKGGIFNSWGKKQAVALHEGFFNTLPPLPPVGADQADIAWFIYGMDYDANNKTYKLVLRRTVYTTFNGALNKITIPEPGKVDRFTALLQRKLNEKNANMNQAHL